MVRPTYLVLHKTEWERLERQGGPEKPENLKNKYLEALTEQSQEWMKTWPDTVTSHMAQLEKDKNKQHKADIAFVNDYFSQKKHENTAGAIKQAKQLIFENSCYGRKLLSSLLESKTLEVRDAQIQFKKDLQQKMAKEQDSNMSKNKIHNFHDMDAEREKNDKLKALECDRVNKEMISIRKEKELQIQLKEKQCAIEDIKLIKQIHEIEEKEKDDIKQCVKQGIEEYEAEKKIVEKFKVHEEKTDAALTEVYKKGQDKIKCKMQGVLRKIHQGRPDAKLSKDLYKKMEEIQSEENKRYEEFVGKGIKVLEERISKKETKEKEQEKQKSISRYIISQSNKNAAEEGRLAKMCANKCSCDRGSLIMKTNRKPSKKTEIRSNDKLRRKTEMNTNDMSITNTKINIVGKPLNKTKCDRKPDETIKLPFLAPRNKLIEELKKREKEPSPWNGAKGVHTEFAQKANDVLKEVKHKHFVRKVVDEYRKLNCLDDITLPVPNY